MVETRTASESTRQAIAEAMAEVAVLDRQREALLAEVREVQDRQAALFARVRTLFEILRIDEVA